MCLSKPDDLQRLHQLVDLFAYRMKEKLTTKAEEGFSGWDDPDLLPDLYESFLQHAHRLGHLRDTKQAVDVANLAMMVWYHAVRK